MAEPARHYTVRRLAEERWGCSLSHVYDLIDAKELKALKIGKVYRIPLAFVEAYEAEHETWQEPSENKPLTPSDDSESSGTSAGQKIASHIAFQLGQRTRT